MNIFGVIVNVEKDEQFRYTKTLINSILDHGAKANVQFSLECDFGHNCQKKTEEDLISNSDIVVCIGGDGTFLTTAHKAYYKNKPIIGVNLGVIGFLAEVDKDNIESAVCKMINNEFVLEERSVLQLDIIRNEEIIQSDIALNDVVISRGALSRILNLNTYFNDMFVDCFPGDGLIISTPLGSTGYTLSAGGPIIEPNVDIIVATPICPHTLYSRSFVTPGDRIVKVEVDESYCHQAMVTADGQRGYAIRGGDIVQTRKSSDSIKVIRLGNTNFFDILRTKIHSRSK